MRVVLRGRMDGEAMRDEGARLTALSGSGQDIIIDMWDVDYIDESGLGVIVYLAKRLRTSGYNLFVTRLTGQPLEYLNRLGCTHLILPDERSESRMRALWAQRTASGANKADKSIEERASADRAPAVRSDSDAAGAGLY